MKLHRMVTLTLLMNLAACGGSGGGSDDGSEDISLDPPPVNKIPVANIVSVPSVISMTEVQLNGSNSIDPDGQIQSYQWLQIDNGSPKIIFSDATQSVTSFIAPEVQQDTELSFKLTVMDNEGASNSANILMTISPVPLQQGHQGQVIDGYLIGATVWLDINNNGQLDEDEPNDVTVAGGEYSLKYNAEQQICATLVPVRVNVPVGAIDESEGEVTSAYQLIYPPLYGQFNPEQATYITPLTSAVWDLLSSNPKVNSDHQNTGLLQASCQHLIENPHLQLNYVSLINEAIDDFTRKSNIPIDDLFSDFIETDNQQLQNTARSYVIGLALSLKKKAELLTDEKYKDASYIRVIHYLDKAPAAEKITEPVWYRDIAIFYPNNSQFFSESARMATDGNDNVTDEVLYVYYRRNNSAFSWGNNGRYIANYDERNIASGELETCFNSEAVEITHDVGLSPVKFKLSNNYAINSGICQFTADIFAQAYERHYSVNYSENKISYLLEFSQFKTNDMFPTLNHWVNLADRSAEYSTTELITLLTDYGYTFTDDSNIVDANFNWHKRKTDDSQQYRVTTDKYYDAASRVLKWIRLTEQSNHTSIQQCSDNGIHWGACS
ncbi:PKD domain-containing protein [Shewanella sp. OMA3-2]|uniref:PKD domain-containing protein n=1 Tax=Shewanella sp. OMA3-2 TaxID=2908650 RepID=UPI001F3B21C7|nr:PKD domain-containing protein [Shewanella sp. OMA3-2]UJF20798.1 PKD domain-containing protein [Shewanella sp. OMA3-2]